MSDREDRLLQRRVTLSYQYGNFRVTADEGRAETITWEEALALARAIEPWCKGAVAGVEKRIRDDVAAEEKSIEERTARLETETAAHVRARAHAAERSLLAKRLVPPEPVPDRRYTSAGENIGEVS